MRRLSLTCLPASVRKLTALGATALALGAVAFPASTRAAPPPLVVSAWSSEVTTTSARLGGELVLDPGQSTEWVFKLIPAKRYQENIAAGRDPFTGASNKPTGPVTIAAGESAATVAIRVTNLVPQTGYRYRLEAFNGSGPVAGDPRLLTTEGPGGGGGLPDGRGWEMVSPIQKNGGQVDGPGQDAGGGVLQAAADGNSVTYSSSVSFEGGGGAPPGSQYVSRRGGESWSTENITTPTISGAYDTETGGVPYQIFSPDLARGLLSNGRRCREGGEGCAVPNPPLPGSGAPSGYRNYYLREGGPGSFQALLGGGAVAQTPLSASRFEVALAGTSADLTSVVLSSCAALTSGATEIAAGSGCDESHQNLYEWQGGGLTPVNVLPGEGTTTPGASLAARSGAISEDGRRVYFEAAEEGGIYLHEAGAQTRLLPETIGRPAAFQAASTDGSVAFFLAEGDLYRYSVATGASTQIATGVQPVLGVLGASADGSVVYYQDVGGLWRWSTGGTTLVAGAPAAAASSDFPPATGTARVSADGNTLAFLSLESEALSEYDNTALGTTQRVPEVYRYEAGSRSLLCMSCNPTGERPLGASTIPGAVANGTAIDAYKPRVLSSSGGRLFFDTDDSLVPQDSDGAPDVYEWEAVGVGTCSTAPGCLALISNGKAAEGATFVDASAVGDDVFFRTAASLVPSDPGSVDLYDARVGGGFPIPPPPIACEGDACQSLPSEPVDPALNTTRSGEGNPPVEFFNTTRNKPRYHRLRNHHHRKAGAKKGKRHAAAKHPVASKRPKRKGGR